MDWKNIAADVGKAAPILGTLIGGPAGPAIGAIIASTLGVANSPDAVQTALATNPQAAVQLAQIEADQKVKLQELAFTHANAEIAAQTQVVQAANQTMQAEAKADHWPTYSWRPFNGFIFGIMAFGVYFVLPLAKVTPPSIPPEVWLAFGGILGVASWFRGQMQANPNVPSDNRG